jgi:tetratricopeptide (TPR) repeat protein
MSPVPSATPTPARDGWKIALVCIALTAAVWLIFAQTLRHGFVNIDDGIYVFRNRRITAGLTREGIGWFFNHTYCDYWAPLLAISHMADCQLYGLWPGGHHLTNIILFNATVLLLFAFLRQLTGALWRSAFVAAAWAVHPLRAESVAWITERKDMLSGLFFVLTLAAYVRYARKPRSWARYLAVAVFFALGLMCKPSVVTLPFVLLLLDYWPLGRLEARADWRPLLVEKIPLFVLSAALCTATIFTGSQTLMSLQQAPLATRLGNAVLSGAIYLGQTFYPARLAAFYPYPEHSAHSAPPASIVLALLPLAGVTAAAVAWRRTHPWVLVGWFWYLGMLVPMIGIVQAGEQAHADRITYLPQIGLLLAITWTVWHWSAALPYRRLWLGSAAAAILAALLVDARVQASYWRNSETLWRHALACTPDNNFARNNLGVALVERGQRDEAARYFEAVIETQPGHVQAQYNLANLLRQEGRTEEAIGHYRQALAVEPGHFDALNNLGIALAAAGHTREAAGAYRRALVLRPDSAEVHGNLGHLLLGEGQVAEAIAQFEKAVESEPDHANGYDGLGGALMLANRPAEAAISYQKALRLRPDDEVARSGLGSALFLQGQVVEAVANWRKALTLQPVKTSTLNNLAWVLATGPGQVRDGAEAVRLAQLALGLGGGSNPVILRTLAAAYAEAGRFPEAREAAGAALELANAQSNRILAAKIEQERAQYEDGVPFHDPPAAKTR